MKFLFKIIVCYLFSFNLVYTDSLIFVKNEAQLSFQNSLVGDVDMASNNKKSLFYKFFLRCKY